MVGNVTNSAINAYQNAGKLNGAGSDQSQDADNAVGTFSDLIKGGIEEAVQTAKASEGMTAQYMMGNADITDVVLAVRDAEATISTITAVRDRVVNAVQEIMRMPI